MTLIASSPMHLRMLRPAWLALALWILFTLTAAIPARYAYLVHPLSTENATETKRLNIGELSPDEIQALEGLRLSVEFYAAWITALETTGALACVGIATFIFVRRSHEWGALVVALALLPLGTVGSPLLETLAYSNSGWNAPVLALRIVGINLVISLFFLFPDGRFVPRWTRIAALIFFVHTLSWIVIPSLRPSMSVMLVRLEQRLLIVWLLLWFGLGAYAQWYRYRHTADVRQRLQTRWVVTASVLAALLTISLSVSLLIISPVALPADSAFMVYRLIAISVVLINQSVVCIALTIAILRHRLYDIDIIIRRTLIYSVLTAILAAVYFGGVIVVQQLFRSLTGQTSDLAIVISTLAIAALFSPLRRRIQNIIDRRFYRRKYDAEQVVAQFNATLREEVDIETLKANLIDVVQEAMQPSHIRLWITTEVTHGKTSPQLPRIQ